MFLLTCKIPPFKPMLKFLEGGLEGSRNKKQQYTKSVWKIAERLHKQLELHLFAILLSWLDLSWNLTFFAPRRLRKFRIERLPWLTPQPLNWMRMIKQHLKQLRFDSTAGAQLRGLGSSPTIHRSLSSKIVNINSIINGQHFERQWPKTLTSLYFKSASTVYCD